MLSIMAKKSPTPTFEPIKPTRAHEAVLAQLQRKILEGELAPGDRLPSEREMMETFGVSRPTVREALRVAEVSGNRLFVVILTALRDPIVRLIAAGLSSATEVSVRAKILRTHGEILKAIRARDGAAADRRSRRHLFDLYAALVAPEERPRLESLLG
jgi:DNA-binding FadR family transcriptional regulator